jgi:hypothetical protein
MTHLKAVLPVHVAGMELNFEHLADDYWVWWSRYWCPGAGYGGSD